jgi:serine/threonine protein kinase
VLVFENNDKTYVARVADFGYSTRFCNENSLVKLPKSVPWNAPEHHHRGIPASKAKKMDIYSFGTLSLWLLFERGDTTSSAIQIPGMDTLSLKDLLLKQRNNNSFLELSMNLLANSGTLGKDVEARLTEYFVATLASNPDDRQDNLEHLLHLLEPKR